MNIAVIFGGESVEHDVSILTGLSVMQNLSKKYTITPIYITRNGEWLTGKTLLINATYEKSVKGDKCFFGDFTQELCVKHKFRTQKIRIDCAILCLHGGLGEGGGVQAILSMSKVPYTSCGVGASSVCMDKILTKLVCSALGIDTLPYVVGYSKESTNICDTLDYPIIIKPAKCGSSVGISVANNEVELDAGLDLAFQFDKRVILEHKLEDFRELNVAAIIGDNVLISEVEEIKCDGVYDFEHKYHDYKTKHIVPAEINQEMIDKIRHIVTHFARECDLFGVVRFDFLLADKLYLNEVNTIPGNLAFYLWKNLSFTKLLSILVENAIRRSNREKGLTTQLKTNLLTNLDKIKPIRHK
jgi:D-alanine-D-alanine ligase